jgi:hypothetical protein
MYRPRKSNGAGGSMSDVVKNDAVSDGGKTSGKSRRATLSGMRLSG